MSPADGKLKEVRFLEEEDVAALDPVEVNRTVRGPWWDQMEQLKERPNVWGVIASWTNGDINDEVRARWLRTRFVQRKAGRIPSGLYELRSRQAIEGGIVVGSELYGKYLEDRPDGVVEYVRGKRGGSGLR